VRGVAHGPRVAFGRWSAHDDDEAVIVLVEELGRGEHALASSNAFFPVSGYFNGHPRSPSFGRASGA
jgi:hypothetical protein